MSEWISTTEAARRIGVGSVTIRNKIRVNELPARREGPIWLVDASALGEFKRSPGSGPRKQNQLTPTGRKAMRLLDEWGSGTSEELALVLEVNPGNVRKGLAIAEKLSFATRTGSDWSLTKTGRQWLVEHAQEVAA
jgi:excisionase family DNA binding protein